MNRVNFGFEMVIARPFCCNLKSITRAGRAMTTTCLILRSHARHSLAACVLFAALLLLGTRASAALVGPTGYTNGFGSQPPAADWATLSRAGFAGDSYTMDADVNAAITASTVTFQTTLDGANPPPTNTNAVWSSPGLYLQTRPTGNRYTALMGKFVNNTLTNATEITFSYVRTIAGSATLTEESGRGTRVYYSLTGLANSWTNIASLNHTETANGVSNQLATIAVNWPHGGSLFLLWADDNANGPGSDPANQLDNFSLRVTAGSPVPFTTALQFPTNNTAVVSGTIVTASATVIGGTPPYAMTYFTNGGAGNTVFAWAGSSGNPPYNVSLGNLPAGTYNIYAVATDSSGVPVSTNSTTNTFFVANPIAFSLTAPTNNAAFNDTSPVTASATVSGGRAPYSVQFYLDDVANGAPVTSAPYERNLGTLFVGDHVVRATVTDANGWLSNSLASTIHIDGALAAILTPTNGSSFIYGRSIILTAFVAGGASPYAAEFYLNDQLVGSFNSPPFTTNLGLLAEGSYTCYVHATDSSLPTAQQTNSSTNVFTILPNPIVVNLTSPTDGQSAPSGVPFAMTATATVGAPLTIRNVEFFYDEFSEGVDSNAPYSRTLSSPATGTHSVYAVATDSAGRINYSQFNLVTFVYDPLVNNNFANRITISSAPAHVTGANAGATLESGEPFQSGFLRWGETLWWRWTAPAFVGAVTIDTIGSDFNTFLGVYTGPVVSALTVVAQNDNASLVGVGASSVTFNAQFGTEYQIQVGGIFTGGGGGIPTVGNIQLNVTTHPSVTINSPFNGTVFQVGGNISVNASASSVSGPITNLSLYRGTTLLGSVATAGTSFTVSNAPVGTNAFYAVAMDNRGQIGTSAMTRVLVANAGLTITAPANGAFFQNTNPITIPVFVTGTGSSITNVRFFVDGQFIGQDSAGPFSLVWNSVTTGPHRLTANGLDNLGNIFYATPVDISVGRNFFPSHSVWKYLDNGSDQTTNWFGLNFDDSTWTNGAAEFGYGDGDEATRVEDNATLGYNVSDSDRYLTTYFRREFVVTNAASYSSLLLNVKCDDGAVVFLNGHEAARFNMNTGLVTYLTPALFAGDDGSTFVPTTVPAGFLREGTNLIAVEVHQSTSDSTDLSFDMDLSGVPTAVLPLKIDSIALAQANVILTFNADANVSYRLEHATALGAWQTLQTNGAVPSNRTIQVTQPASEATLFYRLRSP
jgi:hypothetical protein